MTREMEKQLEKRSSELKNIFLFEELYSLDDFSHSTHLMV